MTQLSALGVVLAGQVEDILLRTGRSIGTIIPQCTVEERARDELAITEHPVQSGAAITDHAYKIPTTVTARYSWSNSGSIFSLTTGGLISSDPSDIYNNLLTLQASRQPFDLQTGKRPYSNMLIKSLEQVTDNKTENALSVTITFQQIIIVDVLATQLKTQSQANPAQTAPVVNGGTVQPKPVPQSVLSTFSGLFGG